METVPESKKLVAEGRVSDKNSLYYLQELQKAVQKYADIRYVRNKGPDHPRQQRVAAVNTIINNADSFAKLRIDLQDYYRKELRFKIFCPLRRYLRHALHAVPEKFMPSFDSALAKEIGSVHSLDSEHSDSSDLESQRDEKALQQVAQLQREKAQLTEQLAEARREAAKNAEPKQPALKSVELARRDEKKVEQKLPDSKQDQAVIAKLEKDKAEALAQAQKLSEQLNELKAQYEAKQASFAKEVAKNAEQEAQLKDLRRDLDVASASYQQMHQQAEGLALAANDLRRNLAVQMAKNSELKEKVNKQADIIQTLKDRFADYRAKTDALITHLKSLSSQLHLMFCKAIGINTETKEAQGKRFFGANDDKLYRKEVRDQIDKQPNSKARKILDGKDVDHGNVPYAKRTEELEVAQGRMLAIIDVASTELTRDESDSEISDVSDLISDLPAIRVHAAPVVVQDNRALDAANARVKELERELKVSEAKLLDATKQASKKVPTAPDNTALLTELREQVQRLEAEKAALEQRVEKMQSQPVAVAVPVPPAPPSNLGGFAPPPPPPPAFNGVSTAVLLKTTAQKAKSDPSETAAPKSEIVDMSTAIANKVKAREENRKIQGAPSVEEQCQKLEAKQNDKPKTVDPLMAALASAMVAMRSKQKLDEDLNNSNDDDYAP